MIELLEQTGAPVVCANLYEAGEPHPLFAPYVIHQYGGKRVAYVGACTPETMLLEGYSFYDTNGILLYDLKPKTFYELVQQAVDAARDEGYLNVLDPRFLVAKARLIPFSGPGDWVDLTGLTRSRVAEMVKMKMEPDGTLTGTAQIVGNNEDSFAIKSHYNDFDTEDAYLEDIESDENLEITHFEIKKEYGPTVEIAYEFEKENEAGGLLYIQPVLSPFHSSSAFRKEDRKLPVDFPYPESLTYSFALEIPDGYVVEELPEKTNLSVPTIGGRIQFLTQQMGSTVNVSYRISLDKVLILPEEYPDLRLFWETAVGIEKSTIVLKKQ